MNWDAVASERTYSNRGRGLRELNRFFYLTGWTLGRREVGKQEVSLAGWIAPMEDLKPVQKRLRAMARIERILEGGRDAFQRRMERYGY